MIPDFEDITAGYMGSDESKNVTGTEQIIDGGMSCQLFHAKPGERKCTAKAKEE